MMMTKFGLADKWILLWTPEKNNFVVADDGEGTLSLSQNISVGLFFSSLFSTVPVKIAPPFTEAVEKRKGEEQHYRNIHIAFRAVIGSDR